MKESNFSVDTEIICTNDCLEMNKNISNKFILVRFVSMRAKALEGDPKTPLKHFLIQIKKTRVLSEDGQMCNARHTTRLIGKASILNALEASNSVEAAMREVYYNLRSSEIDEVMHFVQQEENLGNLNIDGAEEDNENEIIAIDSNFVYEEEDIKNNTDKIIDI